MDDMDNSSTNHNEEEYTSPRNAIPAVALATIPSQASDDSDLPNDGLCGWFCCKPQWLQFFNRPKSFLVFLCLFVLFQGLTVSGMNGVVIPAIERRFRLASQKSGLILGAYDIAGASLAIPVSYLGERAHKPRWLGLGCLMLGIGSLVFTLPHFTSGKFRPDHIQRLETCGAKVNHTSYLSDCEIDDPSVYGILILGQLMIGVGAAPLYTLGVAFLDEIAGPKTVHYFMGAFYACSSFGPAIGFLLGGVFLSQYVDTGVTDHPSPDDPNFVGRWWAGYLVSGFAAILVSVPLMMFPKVLAGTAWIMEEKRKKQKGTGKSTGTGHPEFGKNITDGTQETGVFGAMKRGLRELAVMLKLTFLLLLTPVLLSNTFGTSTEVFAVSGIVPFITKIFQTQFGLTPGLSAILAGIATVFGVVGGILFGSWLIKKRDVHGARLAKYTAVIALVASVFISAFLVHCPARPIVGATRPYAGGSVFGSNRCQSRLNDTCFSSCGCVSERYDPVCGSDGFTYPTPCLAGCQDFRNGSTSNEADRIYTNCQCVASNLVSMGNVTLDNATATNGVCSQSCSLLPLFMILLMGAMFFTFMNNVPAIEVVLQSVPADRRTIATGVQFVLIRCLGNIPGPIFYGFLLDKGCSLWQLSCCKEGNCWEYDNVHMSYSLFAATFTCKSLSFVAFFLSWRFFLHDNKRKALAAKSGDTELSEIDKSTPI